MPLPGVELENDPEDNPCFGCGPKNPVGLRMRFFDDGAVTRCELDLDDRYSGSWGRLLEPIAYAAMDETIVWAAWARFGELPTSDAEGPARLRYHSRVATGRPFVTEARVTKDEGDQAKLFRATITQDSKLKAEMEWPMRRQTRAEIEKTLASGRKLSRSIEAELRGMLARRAQ